MPAKVISVSVDNGNTYRKLPGSSGERRTELANVNDTIFGQDWQSENPTIAQAMISCNAYFKGIAGYSITVKETGTSTAMANEAATLISGKSYQIANAAKRIIDYNVAVVVMDGGTNVTAQLQSIDYLSGTVVFVPTFTPAGAITVSGSYLPLVNIANGKSMTVTQQAAEIDESDYETLYANDGWRVFSAGLRTVSLEIGGFAKGAVNEVDKLKTRKLLVIEVSPDASPDTVFRGFFKRMNTNQSGNVGALEEKTVSFALSVPDGDLVFAPFRWYFGANSKLNRAVRDVITAWQDKTPIKVKYLQDGVNGSLHDAIVTEATLANALEGQNEFRFNFRATGAPTAITG